eukprot:109367_1
MEIKTNEKGIDNMIVIQLKNEVQYLRRKTKEQNDIISKLKEQVKSTKDEIIPNEVVTESNDDIVENDETHIQISKKLIFMVVSPFVFFTIALTLLGAVNKLTKK